MSQMYLAAYKLVTTGFDCKRITTIEECKEATRELGLVHARFFRSDLHPMAGVPINWDMDTSPLLGCWVDRNSQVQFAEHGMTMISCGGGNYNCLCRN